MGERGFTDTLPATFHGTAVIVANPGLHARFMEATAGTDWRQGAAPDQR